MSEHHRKNEPKEVLHRHIVETAMTLFVKEGIKPVTMDRIAKELSISKRTLYEIFKDKETLLIEGIRRYRAMMYKRIKAEEMQTFNVLELLLLAYQHKMDELRFITPRFYKDLKKYPRVVEYLRLQHESEFAGSVAFLQKGVEQGLFRPDVNYEVIWRVLGVQIQFVLDSELTRDMPLTEIFHSIVLVCVRGFSTLAGQKIVDAYLAAQGNASDLFKEDIHKYWENAR